MIREQCHQCVSIRLLSQLSSRLLLVKLSVAQSFSRSYVKPGSHMPPIHLRHTSAGGSSNVYLMFRFTCLEWNENRVCFSEERNAFFSWPPPRPSIVFFLFLIKNSYPNYIPWPAASFSNTFCLSSPTWGYLCRAWVHISTWDKMHDNQTLCFYKNLKTQEWLKSL